MTCCSPSSLYASRLDGSISFFDLTYRPLASLGYAGVSVSVLDMARVRALRSSCTVEAALLPSTPRMSARKARAVVQRRDKLAWLAQSDKANEKALAAALRSYAGSCRAGRCSWRDLLLYV